MDNATDNLLNESVEKTFDETLLNQLNEIEANTSRKIAETLLLNSARRLGHEVNSIEEIKELDQIQVNNSLVNEHISYIRLSDQYNKDEKIKKAKRFLI